MHRSAVAAFVAALLAVIALIPLVFAARAWGKPKPVPCHDARYVFRFGGDALVADSAPLPATVDVAGRGIALGTHCERRNGVVRATKKGTVITAHWPSCGSLKAVFLNATIQPDCHTMTGKLRGRKLKSQTFTAILSSCGDNVTDPGDADHEQCDGTGCGPGRRCNAMCQCEEIPVTTPTTTTSTTTSSSTIAPTTTTHSTMTSTTTTTSTVSTTTVTTTSSTTTSTTTGGSTTTTTTIPVCGDGVRNGTETCDDGPANGTPGDPCPANCIIEPCNPVAGSARVFDVQFTPPAGKQVTGITVNLDYPEGRVSIPGGGPDAANSLSHLPFGAFSQPNDVDWALLETVAKATPITPGRLFTVTFQDCQGATAPTAGDFTCTVTDASDNSSPPKKINGVTCTVVAVQQ